MNAGMSEFQNRTLICSVLFIDIVEYSRKPVVEQSQLKDRFNALLSQALRGVAVNDRIILDTGDGAAISFIGDPEDALFVATGLRDMIETLAVGTGPALSTRMGINLGPVRLVKDINGLPNVIGDGINVAQRVMTFARPGQVLVSRSYYEVVSRLSDESSKLFSYEGARTDKHIREHDVYAVGAIPGVRRRIEDSGEHETAHAPRDGVPRAVSAMKSASDRVIGHPRTATALAVVLILGLAFTARAWRTTSDAIVVPASSVTAPAVADAPAAPEAPLPPIRGLPPEPAAPSAETQQAAAPAEPPTAAAAKAAAPREKPAPRAQVAQSEPPRPPPEPVPAPPPAPAAVSFAISPWGEVHVNGRMQGVSPPLQDIELTPGRHRIEIRNGAFPPHVVTVNARPGERLRIKHKFN